MRHASEKEDQLSKKKTGWLLSILCSTGGCDGKSMVGLEGNYKGETMLLRVLVV